MDSQYEPFCLDMDSEPDLPFEIKRRNRAVGYIATFLTVFTLGTTEIFASWYAGILGGTTLESGLAMGAFGLVYIFSPVIGGRLSDKIGRKRTLVMATIAYIGTLTLYVIPFIAPVHLILIRAIEGFVFGFIAPTAEGMVAELEPDAQATALGNLSTSWSASMILPPMVIAYMAGVYGELSSIYLILAVEILSLVVIASLLQGYRRKIHTRDATDTRKASTNGTVSSQPHSKTSSIFIASYLSVMLWGVISTVILALFPTYIESLITLGYPFIKEDWGNLLLVWNLARTIGFIVIARLPEKHFISLIIIGTVLSALSSMMLFLFIDLRLSALAMAISGFGVGFNYLCALYLVVSATELEKGEHAGLIESMGSVGLLIGPIAGGWVMGFGLALPYLMCAILSFVVLILMLVLLGQYRRKTSL